MRRQRYPFGYRNYGRNYGYGGNYGYGRRRGGGGSCLRDACLIESGCCLAEALGDNCLLGLLAALTSPGRLRSVRHRGEHGALVAAIRVYQQQVSARRPGCCRFSPSCSEYAAQALITHGTVRGGWLAVRRLARCRPYGRRGPDPVPAR